MKQMTIPINEKKFAEGIINMESLPENIFATTAINYMTRYYAEYSDMTLGEVIDKVFDKMDSFKLSSTIFQRYKSTPRVTKIYNEVKDGSLKPLRNYDSIPLYKSEYDVIMSCNTDRERKMLFTLYILARYNNSYGWVYQSETDVYKLANVSTTSKNKVDLFYILLHKGYLKETKKVDDLKVGVDLSEGNEEIIMEVTELKYLGNLFISSISKEHKQCESCGKVIKIKGRNTMYCIRCSKIKEEMSKKARDKRYYENKKENSDGF